MSWYSPVSSRMLTTAVIGARAAAANTAPMPTGPYAPAGPVKSGQAACSKPPYAVPSMAPMNRVGVKTPPEPPMARVRDVATILPIKNRISSPGPYCSRMALSSTG